MNFLEFHEESMKNPEFRKEYEALENEYSIKNLLLESRKEKNLTQEQLSKVIGIDRADISKLERGEGNPTLSTLERIAEGLDMRLRIQFVPR